MSVLKTLRVLARYNILTSIAVLAVAAPGVVLSANVGPGGSSGSIALGPGEDLTNSGTITYSGGNATVYGAGNVGAIINNSGATITSLGDVRNTVWIRGTAQSFSNSGAIRDDAPLQGAVIIEGGVIGTFANTSTGIISNDGHGVALLGPTGTFENAGLIEGDQVDGVGVISVGGGTGFGTFTNSASGSISASAGVDVSGAVGNFANAGRITGAATYGVTISGAVGTFVNTGHIEGFQNGVIFGSTTGTVVNSGTIKGGTQAIRFDGANANILTIRTGSQIFGAVAFNNGSDSLDFSGFAGNTVLDVTGLETLVPGTRSYFDTRIAGDGKIAIFDTSGLGQQAVGQSLLDMLLTSNALISGQLADGTTPNAVPTAFAASAPQAAALSAVDTAVLSELAVGEWSPKIWGGVIGGGSTITGGNNVYGGVLFGSHVQLTEELKLGGTAGYIVSGNQAADQRLASQTAILGMYGQTDIGNAEIDFSLLVGASSHTGTRQIVAGGTTETATGLFNSLFLAPSLGVTLPVLSADLGDVFVRASATYVGGMTTAYTETGSSMNLAVGAQTISEFDARVGFEVRHALDAASGLDADLVAKAGVLAQVNGGSASVPVTGFGQTLNVSTPGSSALGAYGGLGLNAALTDDLGLTLSLDGSVRTDGRASASVNLGIKGTF